MSEDVIRCVRCIQFDAGHRVWRHEGKCRNLHGHRYEVELYAEADALDGIGRVIDFSVLKSKVGGWIDRHWDHAFLHDARDEEVAAALAAIGGHERTYACPFNPTAENIAEFILRHVAPQCLSECDGIRVVKVVVWETPNCRAEASLPRE